MQVRHYKDVKMGKVYKMTNRRDPLITAYLVPLRWIGDLHQYPYKMYFQYESLDKPDGQHTTLDFVRLLEIFEMMEL